MYCYRKINEELYYIGGSDRKSAFFENVFPIEKGVSYNSYLLMDEKTVLIDGVDKAVSELYFENIEEILSGRPLDYMIINHMEPDHCYAIGDIMCKYPDVKIVGNAMIMKMIKQYFDFDIEKNMVLVEEGSLLETGKHTLTFAMAPMVHWPEVMITYDKFSKTVFSADAFGTFGALSGNIFADELDFERDWLDEARRYYTNIVGKYGDQVNSLLNKLAALDIEMICPLHGPIWRENIGWFVEKYKLWADYEAEDRGVVIAYGSVYGHTENAANILATELAKKGITDIKMFDVTMTHPSEIVSECFRASHLVFASTTYNAGIFCNMETLLHDIKAHNLKNRNVAIIENGSWAPTSGGLMREILSTLDGMNFLNEKITVKSSVKDSTRNELVELAEKIANSIECEDNGSSCDAKIDELPKKKYRCKVCGYIYEGDELPEDFTCPICKRPASDFELVEE